MSTIDPVPHTLPSADPGIALRLWEWPGPGPPLLLLHGFGMSARVWDAIAPALAHRRVVAPDARGHGDSDPDPAPRDATRTGVSDLTALVGALSLAPITLVGHSMGAFVAIEFSARRPELVDRLVLIDAGPELPAPPPARRRAPAGRRPPLTGFESEHAYAEALGVLYPRARPDLLRRLAPQWLRRRPDGRYEPKLDADLVRARTQADPTTNHRANSDRLWDRFQRIACPILIVRGEHSTVLEEPTAKRMQRAAHDARLVEIPHAGHAVMLDAPEALSAALVDFVV